MAKKLSFYDVKAKKKFNSDNYRVVTKKNPRTKVNMQFAVAKSPISNIESWRVLGSKTKPTKKTKKSKK